MTAPGADRARFKRAMELFDRAVDATEDAREAILAECTDSEVRLEARRMLQADAAADSELDGNAFMSAPAATLAQMLIDDAIPPSSSAIEAQAAIGPYRLLALLGKGGMGEVWSAERIGADFEQKIAIKILPSAGNATFAVARFRRERRILARLAHPNIARLLDGGVTAEGRPWLAMDLAPGLTLTEHCAVSDLALDARLTLFAKICDAVQFAHRNLVIHRDLKPRNIVVGKSDEPMLLDFGIAKLLGEENDGEGLTREGERPMTPDYAAPEQVRGDAITTATDVWALGVILYELLTGVRPYRATTKGQRAIERAILEERPMLPSACIALTEGASDVRGRPNLSVPALRRALRGDLDAIVLKAMRPAPEDRYPSAEALASDVRNHLAGLPVAARGDAAGYLVRSLIRRHRVPFVFSAIVLAALVFGLAGTLWQAHRAHEEAARAARAQDLVQSMLRAFDPREQGGVPMEQSALLARGQARVESELGDQPVLQAELLRMFAELWCDLGGLERARVPAERALETQRRVLGPRSGEVAKTLLVIGDIQMAKGDLAQAESSYSEALAIARETEGGEGVMTARALDDLGGVKRLRGELHEAEKMKREALAIDGRLLGPEHRTTAEATSDLAVLLADEGKLDESAALQRRACALLEKTRGAKNIETLRCRYNLAREVLDLGNAVEADAILLDVLVFQRETEPDAAIEITDSLQLRGRVLDALGKPGEAIAQYDDVIARYKAIAIDHADVAAALVHESIALRHLKKTIEAEAAAREAVTRSIARSNDDLRAARAHAALGSALFDLGRRDEARDELNRALAIETKSVGADHPDTRATRAELTRLDLNPGQ